MIMFNIYINELPVYLKQSASPGPTLSYFDLKRQKSFEIRVTTKPVTLYKVLEISLDDSKAHLNTKIHLISFRHLSYTSKKLESTMKLHDLPQ